MSSITILFATEMGNSESCATELARDFEKRKLPHRVLNMKRFDHAELPSAGLLLIVTSTTGDGDPPLDALSLYEHLSTETVDLSARTFAVLALGDRGYPNFAQCGKDFDRMLDEAGAARVIDRVDCDGDYERPAKDFREQLYAYFAKESELFPTFLAELPREEPVSPPPRAASPASAGSADKAAQAGGSSAARKSLPRRVLSRVKNKLMRLAGGGE